MPKDGSIPKNPVPKGLSALEQWNATLALLSYLQTVANQRANFIITMEGFIAAATGLGCVTAFSKNTEHRRAACLAVMIVSCVGIALPWFFRSSLLRYRNQVRDAHKQLQEIYDKNQNDFPAIKLADEGHSKWKEENLAHVALVGWSLIILICAWGMFHL
jgi:hypothetical protein